MLPSIKRIAKASLVPALLIAFATLMFVLQTNPTLAAQDVPDVVNAPSNLCENADASASSFCVDKTKAETSNPVIGEDSIFKKILRVLVYATSIISVIMIMIGGLRYVFSGGDANGVKGAKDTILYAVIGLVIALFGQVIITFVLNKL
jgi:hypothetical protein